jgi:leucyl/phenylalanyl-tRNA--protein transferase
MIRSSAAPEGLSANTVLRAYAIGIFPMASSRESNTVHWVAPAMRGVLPLRKPHIPRRLRRTLRQERFEIRCDTAFEQVLTHCAEPRPGHPQTWINAQIFQVFCELFAMGHAHSVETWHDGRLVGGLYGLVLGSAFFGESMFSLQTDASKVALVHLVARLRLGRFTLLDTQFVTDHLRQFGAREIPAPEYLRRLDRALRRRAAFYSDLPAAESGAALTSLMQSSTHTS